MALARCAVGACVVRAFASYGVRVSSMPAPRAVKIELTSQCNYRCGYCAHRLRLKSRGEMEWSLYTRLVGEMVDAGVEELGFFFIGESFICEWLAEAIASLAESMSGVMPLTRNS